MFTDKAAAVAYAEDLLSKAGVNDDTIGAIVAVLSDDATSLERIIITLAGDRAVSKLKALVKGATAVCFCEDQCRRDCSLDLDKLRADKCGASAWNCAQ